MKLTINCFKKRVLACVILGIGFGQILFAAPIVDIKTNQGHIIVELNEKAAPKTVENFLAYVSSGDYEGTIFHRVIEGFMIQGGGFDTKMQQRPTKEPINIESNNGLKNQTGTIAMARTNDPNSATSQFFINLKDNEFLNYRDATQQGYGYTVFGKVIEGMDVVDKIKAVKTTTKGMHENVPMTNMLIEKITVLEPAKK